MSDDALAEFSQELVAAVEEALSPEVPFSQVVFTRLVLEQLEDAGHLDGTFPLYQEGRVRNAAYRIDGYAHDEERARLDLFTTIYSGDLPAAKLPAAEVTKALERALRFASACVDGLASQLEPANTDASDLARLIETEADKLVAIRIVLLTDGIVGKLGERQGQEWDTETRARADRLPKGLRGLWHRIIGQYRKVRLANEAEALATQLRHARQTHALISRQLGERAVIQKAVVDLRREQAAQLLALRRDLGRYLTMRAGDGAERTQGPGLGLGMTR